MDAEVQYIAKFDTGKAVHHDLHIGASYRYKEVTWTLPRSGPGTRDHAGLFLHEEMRLRESRGLDRRRAAVDYVPYLQRLIASPRASILVHPSKESTIRAVAATAFRTPTFLESYLNIPLQLPVAGGALVSQGIRTDDPTFKVQPERIFTAELGYLNQESDKVTIDASIFYNHASNLIQLAPNRAITVGDVANGLAQPDPATGLYPLFFGGFNNRCQSYNVPRRRPRRARVSGGGLDVYGNYTLNEVQQDNSGCSATELATIVKDERTSAHKVNLGVQLRTKPGFDGSVDLHYVSPQTWGEPIVNPEAQSIEYQPCISTNTGSSTRASAFASSRVTRPR